METITNTDIQANDDARNTLVPLADYSLTHLSDTDLLANTRRLVGSSNQLFAALLAHLAEVETRGVHRSRACSSLYTYCIYELRMSEDAAFRRATAAKLVKRFPALFDAIDTLGQECRERHGLELHHLRAFARGGEHTVSNLALRCRAHNTLAAEKDFGRELVEQRRGSSKHEPLRPKDADRLRRSGGL